MMGIITGAGRMLGLVFALSSPPPHVYEDIEAVNRLKNPGFEYRATDDGTYGDKPEYWTRSYYSTNSSYSVISGYKKHGDQCLQINDTSTSLASGMLSDPVFVTSGQVYTARAWMMRSASAAYGALYLRFYDSTGAQLSQSAVSGGAVGAWDAVELSAQAPENAVSARVLLYSSGASVGSVYVDSVSFVLANEEWPVTYTVKYAAPAAAGDGSGSSAENAALYTSSELWDDVRTRLSTDPVNVILLEGNYTEYLGIGYVGNEKNRLLICGETPYAVNYSDATNSVENYFLYFSGCTNITLRHINFTAEEDPERLALKDNTVHDYRGVLCLNRSVNISLEGLTFTGLLMMEASASSVWAGSHDITWKNCSYVNTGWDLYDHCIYNTSLAYNLNVENCYFQDCAGVYVRYRSGSRGAVTDNTFISTGTQPTGNLYDRRHWSFVQVCALNNGNSDEILSESLVVSNNSFTFENTAERGFRAPFWIYAQGPAPTNHPGWHMVPPATGDVIEDTSADIALRNSYLQQYFGIDLMNNYQITDNAYAGCWPVLFMMTSEPADRITYWTNLPSETPANNCDLDALVGLD